MAKGPVRSKVGCCCCCIIVNIASIACVCGGGVVCVWYLFSYALHSGFVLSSHIIILMRKEDSWPRGYTTFFHFHVQLNWARNFSCSLKLKYRQIKVFLALSLSDVVFIMLINVKMPTSVGILTFMSKINFVLSWAELSWKTFYNIGALLLFFLSVILISFDF